MEEFLIKPPMLLQDNSKNCHVIAAPDDNRDILSVLHTYGYVFGETYIDFRRFLKYQAELLLSEIQKRGYEATFIFAPNLRRMQNCSAAEQMLLNMPAPLIERSSWLFTYPAHIRDCYRRLPYYSLDYLRQIFTGSEVLERGGTYIQRDMRSQYVNVSGGMRRTTDQPESYRHAVHFFGNSFIYGFGVEDRYTLPSCLQRELNRRSKEWLVLNYGVRGLAFENYLNKINSAAIKKDDRILLYFKEEPEVKEALMARSVSYIDLTEFLYQKRLEDLFFDWESHLNYKGNLLAAGILSELLFSSGPAISCGLAERRSKIARNDAWLEKDPDFRSYAFLLENLPGAAARQTDNDRINGGIVMNCNPLTFGHLHLIQVASLIVDCLYVFVVSEDRSEIAFEDRLRLVREGTKDLANVIVIPSGRFILSAATFPEYFSKNEKKDAEIDMSKDLDIFGSAIAPRLHITIRFVGEEPYDPVTKQYNDSMKRILPDYQISVMEIPRRKIGHTYISASYVRKLWHNGAWEELKKYVPECTYRYLRVDKDKSCKTAFRGTAQRDSGEIQAEIISNEKDSHE